MGKSFPWDKKVAVLGKKVGGNQILFNFPPLKSTNGWPLGQTVINLIFDAISA
jgi:hypothetical protein